MAGKSTAAANDGAPLLPVLDGEDPWTKDEVDDIRTELVETVERMENTIAEAETELAAMMSEGPDGAGKDPADVGSSNFERDQEMSLAANSREMLEQAKHALRLLDEGVYGSCESCSKPIGKMRLQAFPRATMCVTCKQLQERR